MIKSITYILCKKIYFENKKRSRYFLHRQNAFGLSLSKALQETRQICGWGRKSNKVLQKRFVALKMNRDNSLAIPIIILFKKGVITCLISHFQKILVTVVSAHNNCKFSTIFHCRIKNTTDFLEPEQSFLSNNLQFLNY